MEYKKLYEIGIIVVLLVCLILYGIVHDYLKKHNKKKIHVIDNKNLVKYVGKLYGEECKINTVGILTIKGDDIKLDINYHSNISNKDYEVNSTISLDAYNKFLDTNDSD